MYTQTHSHRKSDGLTDFPGDVKGRRRVVGEVPTLQDLLVPARRLVEEGLSRFGNVERFVRGHYVI